MLTIYSKNDLDDEFRFIQQPEPGCWIHVDNATMPDIDYICKLIGLNHRDLQDCLDKYEIPRIEKIDEKVLVLARHPTRFRESGLFTTTFAIILAKQYFITICPSASYLVQDFILHKPKLTTCQNVKFLIYILLKITQAFTRHIKKIGVNVLKQEKAINHIESEDINNLTTNEENLNQYLATLIPLRTVLAAISSGKYTLLHAQDQDLLEDLLNASIQSKDLCSTNLRSIRSLRDSYQIIFTNQLNNTIKLLTALTICIPGLPTMIASLYGMNVKLPMSNSPYAFLFVFLFIICVGAIAYYIFQRKRWL
jgi:magnesium transporter